jgi:hypothetical protein
MRRKRGSAIGFAITMALVALSPTMTYAAKPAAGTSLTDISATVRGAELAAETADRFTSLGDPTAASDLQALQYSNGNVLVVRRSASAGITTSQSADGSPVAYLDVGNMLDSGRSSNAGARPLEVVASASSSTWQQRESSCLASLYVQSARLDSCYWIFQLTSDGSPTKDYWALRQKGTAFEYESGLHHAWISGERTPNTASQAWQDWEPDQLHTGNCSSMNLGVSYIIELSYSVTACENWYYDKSCNTCSPWLQTTWDCGCWFAGFGGLHIPPTPISRAIAYQMIVSTSQGVTPRFRLGIELEA